VEVLNFPIPAKEKQSRVLALGNFDGVHSGHRQLLRQGKEIAAARGLPLYALLFDPHPLKILCPEKPLNMLSDQETKIQCLRKCGVDKVCFMRFDRALADTPAGDFARKVLLPLGTAHVVVGFNYSFGKDGQGKPEDLLRLGQEYGFGVTVVQAQKLGQQIISSTAIRTFLAEGDLVVAAAMLGRSPCLRGLVETGEARGRELGFPTANLRPATDILVPGNGVYAARGLIGRQWYDAMLNIGVRPTYGTGLPRTIEIHFFDFDANLYGREILVTLEARLRDERRFTGPEEMRAQLEKDRTKALCCLRSRTDQSEGP
jgi:riboflavin kinase/FMN adenylyltransferase